MWNYLKQVFVKIIKIININVNINLKYVLYKAFKAIAEYVSCIIMAKNNGYELFYPFCNLHIALKHVFNSKQRRLLIVNLVPPGPLF